MYHAVESAPRPPRYKHFYVLAREFERQMRALKRAGYTALTFDDLDAALRDAHPLPPKPILLTFDDGYANLWDNVHPLLHALGFPYTVFLVSEKIGKTNDWVAAAGYEPTPLLTWDKIRQMQQDGGVDFQAHTATHPHLARIPLSEARREMTACKDVLEQHLQNQMCVLCYPYGDVNDAVAEAAGEIGYRMAVTTKTGRVRLGDDPLRLPRLSVIHVPPLSLTYGVGSLNFWWRVKRWKDTRPTPSSPPTTTKQII
jgi:peptidoglycan/xylan/chitin deacetylase (PgdA/CDA1 family)